MSTAHNHRRKLIRRCRKEAVGNRKKGYELLRGKVAAFVKAREGAGVPLTAILVPA